MGHRTANWTDKVAPLVEIDFVDAADPAPIGDRVDVMLVLCEVYHLAFFIGFAQQFIEASEKIIDRFRIHVRPVQYDRSVESQRLQHLVHRNP
jgi:hypothetical protein